MELTFEVNHQHIKCTDTYGVVADSINYLTANFSFTSEEWTGVIKTAVFRKGDVVKNQILTDDSCDVPWEVIKHGEFTVSVFGGLASNGLITVDVAKVKVGRSGYKVGETPLPPSPTVYDQLVEMTNEAIETAQAIRDDADNGEFNGTDGKSAYQSYLDTTTDNPPLTEADWSASRAEYTLPTSVEEAIDTKILELPIFEEVTTTVEGGSTQQELTLNPVSGSFMHINGTLTASSSYWYCEISVSAGETYRITNTIKANLALYVVKDSGGNVLSSYPSSSIAVDTSFDETIVMPANASKLYVTYKTGTVCKVYKVTTTQSGSVTSIEVKSDCITKKMVKDEVLYSSSYLYNKKYVACGDSFTQGDFTGYIDSNGNTGESSDAYDSELGMYKTYPWWIAKRNGMTVVNMGDRGCDFTNVIDAVRPFSVSKYLTVPTDADYITLMFGLNEKNLTADQIGTSSDTTNATLWGAYNIVFEYLITNIPYAKIGVIISDWLLTETYITALKEICDYWGIPYIDLRCDKSVPMGINGRIGTTISSTAVSLRDAAFKVSGTNNHPNLKAHEYRSTFIENWLRSL